MFVDTNASVKRVAYGGRFLAPFEDILLLGIHLIACQAMATLSVTEIFI